MNVKAIGFASGTVYFCLYLIAMSMPRNSPAAKFPELTLNYFQRIFHEVLYYNGRFEPLANYLLMAPIFFFLISIFGTRRSLHLVLFCIALSVTAEILQNFIPGRVSSLKDILLNASGAVTAAGFIKLLRIRINPKIYL